MSRKCIPAYMTVIAALMSISTFHARAAEDDLQLQQVVVVSRHGVRTPLAGSSKEFANISPRKWHSWDSPTGYLTVKGGLLETYMGHYTRLWLDEQKLLKANQCPDKESVLIYTNTLQRTIATGQFFATGAFPGCDIAVTHQDDTDIFDPMFEDTVHNDEPYREAAVKQIENNINALKDTSAYLLLEKVIDYPNSQACKNKKNCHLSNVKNRAVVPDGKPVAIDGPLEYANKAADALIMAYNEGVPFNVLDWGVIKSSNEWSKIASILDDKATALYTAPNVAQAMANPLIEYIDHLLIAKSDIPAPKFTALFAHDSTIYALLARLNTKPWNLPQQLVKMPVGGQVMFQHWYSKKSNKHLFKLEYVYQTNEQLRDAKFLDLQNPPGRVTLALRGCPIDNAGFCNWDQFVDVINQSLTSDGDKQSASEAVEPIAATTEAPEQQEQPKRERSQ